MTNLKFQKGIIYIQGHDPKIPVFFTGRSKVVFKDYENVRFYEFCEVITPENQNWCKGEHFWGTGTGYSVKKIL